MGFENDKLDRKEYAQILEEIIEKPEIYKRNSDSDSFTLAIDSGWGTGKTEFLNMWSEELQNKKVKINNKEQAKYIIISYNAWKNDFSENPLQTVIYTILSSNAFNKINNAQKGKKALKEAFESIINFSQNIIPGGELIKTGIDEIKKVSNEMKKQTCMDDMLEEYEEYISNLNKVKELLEKVTANTKIIIMVDELDRCKPIFAIKLLETIKHLFNVKNMSFIFALDMTQLSYSIKKIYGTEIDASGYICRFFDYITKMPKPDIWKYIKYLMEKRPLKREQIEVIKKEHDPVYGIFGYSKGGFTTIFKQYIDNYNLSLRDINTIYNNFVIFEERELQKTNSIQAYALYLFLIILKYKNLELFNKIFIENSFNIGTEEYIKKLENISHINIEAINKIMSNKLIYTELFRNTRGDVNILEVDTETKRYKYKQNDYPYVDKYTENISLSGCLFYQDLENYNNIKNMTLVQYIHKKLELFDFTWEKSEE